MHSKLNITTAHYIRSAISGPLNPQLIQDINEQEMYSKGCTAEQVQYTKDYILAQKKYAKDYKLQQTALAVCCQPLTGFPERGVNYMLVSKILAPALKEKSAAGFIKKCEEIFAEINDFIVQKQNKKSFVLDIPHLHRKSYPTLKAAQAAYLEMRNICKKAGCGDSFPFGSITNGSITMKITYNGKVWDENDKRVIVK